MSDFHAIPFLLKGITVPFAYFKPNDVTYGRNLLYILPTVPQGKLVFAGSRATPVVLVVYPDCALVTKLPQLVPASL